MKFLTSIIAVLIFACIGTAAAEADHTPAAISAKNSAAVSLYAKTVQPSSKSERTIEIQLTIGDEFEIYSQLDHGFFMPLKLRLLDAQQQTIECTIRYPKAKAIPFDDSPDGNFDYYVYSGKPTLLATYPADQNPAYVTLFYHGHSKHGY